jgi:hypothetical protein
MKTKINSSEPESGAVNSGIDSLPIVKYVKTNKYLIIAGAIVVIVIILAQIF